MPIEGIKMSLIHSCPPPPPPPLHVSYTQSLSLLDLGWWPSATKDTKANKSSSFQHLSSPKELPTAATPPLVKMGPRLYSSFSILPHTHTPPLTPPPRLTKRLLSRAQVKKRPSFPLFDKSRLKPRWGLPAEMPGTLQGCPHLPPPLPLFSRPPVHPSLALALFFTFNTPLLWGSLAQLPLPIPFHTGELSASHKDIK